jgi:hypothetical protein
MAWKIVEEVPGAENGYRAIVDEDGFTICNPSPMGEDYARLIAAAPDMLTVIQELVFQIQQMKGMFDDSDGAIRNALKDADSVLDFVSGIYLGD